MGAPEFPFIREVDEYLRNVTHRKNAIEQTSIMLARRRNISYDEAYNFVIYAISKEGPFPLRDPLVKFMELLPNGDHEETQIPFSKYIERSIRAKEYIAPSGTTYKNVRDEVSLQKIRLDKGVKDRKFYKNLMFKAVSEALSVLAAQYHNLQNSKKTENNGNSGTYNSDGNPLINPPAHSALTSTCRITSGYGNANNEMLISGNRHYYNHKVVVRHIMTILHKAPLEEIEAVMNKYNLHYPTYDETINVITRCTQLYFFYGPTYKSIETAVAAMTPVERAAFCYIGDLYTLRRFNKAFVREWLLSLTEKVTPDTLVERDAALKSIKIKYETVRILATTICQDEMEGKGDKFHEVSLPSLSTISATADHIDAVINNYSDMIKAFYATEILPIGVASFPSSIRRVTPISDTDSTMFTAQEWLMWHSGNYKLAGENLQIWYGIVFMAATTIVNILAQMSRNIGIEDEDLFKIAMKSEFMFRQIIPMNVGKHYIATAFLQEGVVLKKLRLELKGVGLVSAAMPQYIRERIQELAVRLDKDLSEKGTISHIEYISYVIQIEKEIRRSMLAAESTFFKNEKIKVPGSYTKDEDESPYKHHTFWNETFGVKYGLMPEPPYGVRKIPIGLKGAKLRAWIESFKDDSLRLAFTQYLNRNNIKEINLLRIPSKKLLDFGMLEEVKDVVAIKEVTMDIMKPIYTILEAIGFYNMGEKNVKRLFSETYPEFAATLEPLKR